MLKFERLIYFVDNTKQVLLCVCVCFLQVICLIGKFIINRWASVSVATSINQWYWCTDVPFGLVLFKSQCVKIILCCSIHGYINFKHYFYMFKLYFQTSGSKIINWEFGTKLCETNTRALFNLSHYIAFIYLIGSLLIVHLCHYGDNVTTSFYVDQY